MPKLTKRTIDAADARATAYTIWCDELAGFGLRVNPTGKKTYLCDYKTGTGERRRMSLGAHGPLTPDEARKLALATLGDAVRGDDPQREKVTRRKSLTVAQLCDRYLEAAEKGLILGKGGSAKKASTLATDRGRVAQHIVPLLGKKLVMEVTRADVSKFVRDVQSGRTAKCEPSGKVRGITRVTGGPGTAARTAGLLGAILTFAVSEGVIDTNPATGVRKPAYGTRERRLSPGEYARLGAALAAVEDEGERRQGVDAVRLLVLTGCRLGEVQALQWRDVDFAGRCLRLADSKEGRSVRPLGAAAVALLEEIRGRVEGDYVLPPIRGDGPHYAGFPAAWRRIAKRAEIEGATAHTLRHSFASVAGDLGMSESTIGALLGHAKGSVTSKYVHALDVVLLAAADRVTGEIAAQMATAFSR